MSKTNMTPSKQKQTHITIDADTKAILTARQDQLSSMFGFKPTLSQTLRSVLKKEDAEVSA